MKLSWTALLLCLPAWAAQSGGWSGTWVSEDVFENQPRAELRLHCDSGRCTGKITMRGITENGDEDFENPIAQTLPLLKIRKTRDEVRFFIESSQDRSEWRLVRTGPREMELRIVEPFGPRYTMHRQER